MGEKYTIKNKIYAVAAVLLASVFVWSGVLPVSAQTAPQPATPSRADIDAQMAAGEKGPSAAEIEQFKKEFGGAPDSFPEPAIERPQFEQPGTIPADVRAQIGDKDLVAVYCAMTKWRSGDFFSAMDGVKEYVVKPTEQIKADFSLTLSVPDVDAIKADGQKRIDAICGAKTVDEAQQLANEFMTWGQETVRGQFDAMRTDMQTQLKAKGDALRAKVEAAIEPYIDEQKAAIQAEMESLAQSVVDQKIAAMQARFASSKAAPDMSAVQSEISQAVNAAIEARLPAKKAEMQAKITEKVNEIVGPEKAKFESIGKSFANVDQKINALIKSNAANYLQYKKEAFDLRKSLVLSLIDKNIADGLQQLDAAAGDIDEAKKNGESTPDVATLKAQLQADRKVLETKLDAAFEAGDEAAFQSALQDFRTRWEAVQKDGEKALQQSASKVCTIALAQFRKANEQMAPGEKRIVDLQTKCANSASDECVNVNKFASRFETVVSKMTDIRTEMSIAAKMCATPETADRKNLIALMKKIQTDATDLKAYGDALEADKTDVLNASVSAICAQAIPQLTAAEREIRNNSMTTLENNLANCKGKKSEACGAINKLGSAVTALKKKISTFENGVANVKKLCEKSGSEETIASLSETLNTLKESGDDLRAAAQDLQAEQAKELNSKALCRAVLPQLEMARQEATVGFDEANATKTDCAGKTDEKCAVINENSAQFTELRGDMEGMFTQISAIKAKCANASADTMDEELITLLENIKGDKQKIEAQVADLQELAEQQK